MDSVRLLDVFGQFENQGVGHYYTYIPNQHEPPTGWKIMIKDPKNEVAAYMQYCYLTWCTDTEWWIAKMLRNPHDPQGGFAMLSICLGANRPADGEKAITLLDTFAQFFIIEKNWNDTDAEKVLMNQEQDFVVVPCVPNGFILPSVLNNSAYRNYDSRQELARFLSFLPQPGYERYSRIFFVSREESAGMPVECLDNALPLKKIYTLKYPVDCMSPSRKTEIMDGEEMVIVYAKEGMQPVKKVIKGGESSDYAYVEGDFMFIRSEKEIGLVHDKAIEVRCQDKFGNVIDGFKLEDSFGQDHVRIEGSKLFVPENFFSSIVLDVVPKGDKYDQKRIELNQDNIKDNILTIVLEPIEYKVFFRIGNTDFETTETMSPSTAKMKWGAYDCDINNIGRTICFIVYGKPTEKVSHETIHTVVERPSIIKSVRKRFSGKKKWLLLLLVLLFGYGIYACVSLLASNKNPWPFRTKPAPQIMYQIETETQSEAEADMLSQETVSQDKKSLDVAPTIVAVADVDHQHDINYLKREKVWTVDSLRTQEYKSLFDGLKEGDIDKVIQLEGVLFDSTNIQSDFKKIVDGLTKFKNADNQQKLKMSKDEMIRLCKRGSFEVGELSYSINLIDKRN
jgi:hypothetical protein